VVETGVIRKGLDWAQARLTNCAFVGEYEGSTFGHNPNLEFLGLVLDCDFSLASLHGCFFCGVDEGRIKFAGWPTVVAKFPHAATAARAADWPASVYGLKFELSAAPSVAKNISFVAYDARKLAKKYRVKLDLIQRMVAELPEAFMT
jgi:hypothetical protein